MLAKAPQVPVILLLLLVTIHSKFYSIKDCPNTQYLNSATFQCISCPTNQIARAWQTIPLDCECAVPYTTLNNNVCGAAVSGTCGLNGMETYSYYDRNGQYNPTGTCNACASSLAYANKNLTKCIPCPPFSTYNPTTQSCVCTGTLIKSDLGCFSVTMPTGNYINQLKYLIPGCDTFKDYLSCSELANLCSYSLADMNTAECTFFSASTALKKIIEPDASGFSLSAAKQLSLSIKLVIFKETGNYVGQKDLLLVDLMRCGTPSDSGLTLILGTNIRTTCTYDFNNLLLLMQSKQYVGKMYQMLIKGDTNSYYQIPVMMPGSSQPVKRFFFEDSYTYANKINVMTGFIFSFTLDGSGKLVSPKFSPKYSMMSFQVGSGIVPSGSGLVSLSYQISYSCDLSSFWTGAIASFITISVLALVHTSIKTYIGYLNRKSALLFFLNLCGVYAQWLFYYLLFMSGYWFLFTKTTSSPFLLLPTTDQSLYSAFYALVAIMVVFRLIWVFIDKSDKLSTEVFLINWERSQFKNSWRDIFIVRSLAQFYTYRTISLFWMLAILMFFMNGVGWQKLAAQTISTDSTSIYTTLTQKNRLLLYFISCAVFLAIGIIFKLLRRLSVIVWPYPFQNFADYCSVTNISFLFLKRRSPHAYYLHAKIPDRTEVTFKEINESIRRGLNKNRSIISQFPLFDSLNLYNIYLNRQVQDKYTQMLKKIEDQEHAQMMKYSKENSKKHKINHREQFIQSKLKPSIERVDTRKVKSCAESMLGLPPINLRDQNALRIQNQVFFDNQLQIVNQVFPNGNEFQQIHTLIIFFLGWVTLVNSCPIAAFITYFMDEYVFNSWISYTCRVNLQQMTKVKRGFML